MNKKSDIDIIIIEKSYLIAKALSAVACEEFGNSRVVRDVKDFDELMSLAERWGSCVIALSAEFIKENLRYFHRLPMFCSVIPVIVGKSENTLLERFKYSINIYDSKREIADTFHRAAEELKTNEAKTKPEKDLTKREELVLQLIAKGLSSKAIANRLGISLQTVSTHRKNITSKLSIKTISGLTVYAILNGLITTDNN